eukprot:366070-Chlamydomonas_euryale.AAC.6
MSRASLAPRGTSADASGVGATLSDEADAADAPQGSSPGVSQGAGENRFREVEKRYQLHKDQVMKRRCEGGWRGRERERERERESSLCSACTAMARPHAAIPCGHTSSVMPCSVMGAVCQHTARCTLQGHARPRLRAMQCVGRSRPVHSRVAQYDDTAR